jgi:leader peptidase (prepilin peptidase)/N-methyltransferase
MSFYGLGFFLYVLFFCGGLALGSFFNALVWRIKEKIPIWKGRSKCVGCKKQLVWYEIIPVVSYVWLGGKCRRCQFPIPWHYPLVEITTGVMMVQIGYHNGQDFFNSWFFLRDIFLLILLMIIGLYDALYKEILSIPVWIGIVGGFFFSHGVSASSVVVGVVISSGFFLLQYVVSRGTWIGWGDVYIAIMMGVWLGWPRILVGLFFAYLVGGVYGLLSMVTKKKQWRSEIPFGPFLTIGTFIAFFYGKILIQWYTQFI